MPTDTNPSQFAIPAIILGTAALISPILAIHRWVQEKTVKSRYRAEMQHSQELQKFIENCPKLTEVAGVEESALDTLARAELTKSLAGINILLNRKSAKEAPPTEMSWVRRCFLLYSPRTKWATFFHTLFQLLFVFVIAFILLFSYDEDQGVFTFNDFHHPIFWAIMAVWIVRLGMVWYIASTKDHWDGALPPTKTRLSKFFLRYQPGTAQEVIARLFLFWAVWDIVAFLIFNKLVGRDFHALLNRIPELQKAIDALPDTTLLEKAFSWAASVVCLGLGYLWAKAERAAQGHDLWFPFPRKLRFFYPSAGWEERFSQLGMVLIGADIFLTLYYTRQAFAIFWPLIPEEAKDPFFIGFFTQMIQSVIPSFLALYGCYRLGLIAYKLGKEQPASNIKSTNALEK